MAQLSELVTVSEAAQIKGVPPDTVRRRIARKRLRALMKGNMWLIERKELENWTVRKPRKPNAAGVVAQARIKQLREMQQRLAPGAPTVAEYLAFKQEEREQERRRDESRDAQRP